MHLLEICVQHFENKYKKKEIFLFIKQVLLQFCYCVQWLPSFNFRYGKFHENLFKRKLIRFDRLKTLVFMTSEKTLTFSFNVLFFFSFFFLSPIHLRHQAIIGLFRFHRRNISVQYEIVSTVWTSYTIFTVFPKQENIHTVDWTLL